MDSSRKVYINKENIKGFIKKNKMILLLFLFFIVLTILVKLGLTNDIDSLVYNFVISFKSDVLTSFFRIITRFVNTRMTIILTFVIMLILRNKYSLYIGICTVDTLILNSIVKLIIGRVRPNILKLISIGGFSYPSGHSMMAMSLFGFLIWYINTNYSKKYKYIFISILSILILLIGLSRIYLGVHYFTDVVGGFLLSFIYLLILVKTFNFSRELHN